MELELSAQVNDYYNDDELYYQVKDYISQKFKQTFKWYKAIKIIQ